MADRMALLMTDLVRRDLDYGDFCFEEFYTGEVAEHLRKSREYENCLDFVRMMLRRHDEQERAAPAQRGDAQVAGNTDAG